MVILEKHQRTGKGGTRSLFWEIKHAGRSNEQNHCVLCENREDDGFGTSDSTAVLPEFTETEEDCKETGKGRKEVDWKS